MTPHGDAHAEQWAETNRCRVVGVRRFGSFSALELLAPDVAAMARPGQFVMVTVPGAGLLPASAALDLHRPRRPRSACSSRRAATAASASPPPRSARRSTSPARSGSAFPVDGVRSALLVGGGIGCAPLQFLADELEASGAQVTAAFGFRDGRQARLAGAFDLARLWVATEDGSVGRRGMVIDLLAALDVAASTTVLLLRAGADDGRRAALGVAEPGSAGYASLEAHMACGTGACHGCVVATTQRRTCASAATDRCSPSTRW